MATLLVRYHAAARELAGAPEEPLDVPDHGLAARALLERLALRHERLAPHLSRMRLAVNGEFAPADVHLGAGDVVDLLPPFAGGSAVALSAIRDTPLSLDECVRAVSHPSAGGIAIFTGVVRDHADGKAVARLDYEHHETLAPKAMLAVLEGVAAEIPGTRLAATHRVGPLAVGDLAVVVAASAPHRDEAFRACRLAIDRIKESVPIWKKEWEPGGEASWVNLEPKG